MGLGAFHYEPPTHELKAWPEPFAAVWSGRKTHEWRRDDRGFRVGDRVVLCEFDPVTGAYSGRRVVADVNYISRGPDFGIPEGFAVLSIRPLWRGDDRAMIAFGA